MSVSTGILRKSDVIRCSRVSNIPLLLTRESNDFNIAIPSRNNKIKKNVKGGSFETEDYFQIVNYVQQLLLPHVYL